MLHHPRHKPEALKEDGNYPDQGTDSCNIRRTSAAVSSAGVVRVVRERPGPWQKEGDYKCQPLSLGAHEVVKPHEPA